VSDSQNHARLPLPPHCQSCLKKLDDFIVMRMHLGQFDLPHGQAEYLDRTNISNCHSP
jgi:hypothetical protein